MMVVVWYVAVPQRLMTKSPRAWPLELESRLVPCGKTGDQAIETWSALAHI